MTEENYSFTNRHFGVLYSLLRSVQSGDRFWPLSLEVVHTASLLNVAIAKHVEEARLQPIALMLLLLPVATAMKLIDTFTIHADRMRLFLVYAFHHPPLPAPAQSPVATASRILFVRSHSSLGFSKSSVERSARCSPKTK